MKARFNIRDPLRFAEIGNLLEFTNTEVAAHKLDFMTEKETAVFLLHEGDEYLLAVGKGRFEVNFSFGPCQIMLQSEGRIWMNDNLPWLGAVQDADICYTSLERPERNSADYIRMQRIGQLNQQNRLNQLTQALEARLAKLDRADTVSAKVRGAEKAEAPKPKPKPKPKESEPSGEDAEKPNGD